MKKKKILTNKIIKINNRNKNLNKREFINLFWKNKNAYWPTWLPTFKLTFNLIYFFSKYWELGNWEFKFFLKLSYLYENIKFDKKLWFKKLKQFRTKWYFFRIKWKFFKKIYWNFLWKKIIKLWLLSYLINFWFYLFTKSNYDLITNLKNKFLYTNLKKNKQISIKLTNLNIKSNNFNSNNVLGWIKGFLFIWAAKSNFFVTILDYMGNTLVTWSGGNTGRTGTRQRSTVFSADNAIYECCFLAKEWGLESVIIHIKSSLWIQQVKHCFDGLAASGLVVEHVVYWPLKSFGGCWEKKSRRV